MSLLALPYLAPDAGLATRGAVAASLNGVTPELRSHALRKVRAAIRRKAVSPARVARAVAGGDAGLASLFPVRTLPGPPSIPASSLPSLGGAASLRQALASSTWFITLAVRRNCAPEGLLSTLTEPTTAPSVGAGLLLDAWNRLLESYRPDWLPKTMAADRPRLVALPSHLCRETFYGDECDGTLLKITTTAISRMFLDEDEAGYAPLREALLALDKATVYPLIAADPVAGREYFNAYVHPEFYEDLRQHVVWPEGASEPVADIDAITVLIEECGYDAADAEHFARLACDDLVSERKREQADAQAQQADGASTSAFAEVAKQVRRVVDHLNAMPRPARKLAPRSDQAGYPVHLVATHEGDAAYDDLVNAIDMECQEELPSMCFEQPKNMSASALDSQMERLVVEMIVADYVYGLISSTFGSEA